MTRPTSSADDDVAHVHLARVQVDVDLGDARRPAEARVGVAAVRLVVELDARVRLELLVDAQRRRCAARSPRYDVGERPAGRSSTSARSRSAASMTRPPTTIAVRDATVGPLSGTIEVSRAPSRPPRSATPSVSATSCGKIVLVPWPISVEAIRTRIVAVRGRAPRRATLRQLDLAAAGEPGAVPGEREADAVRLDARAVRTASAARARPRDVALGAVARGCARTRTPRPPAPAPRRRRRSRAGPGRSASTSPRRYTQRRRSSSGDDARAPRRRG